MVSFADLGVEPILIEVLKKQGILEPFEVQRESIPDGMLGRDAVSYTHLTLPTILRV